MNMYQSKTYRKDLRWIFFGDEPRIPEEQQVKDQHSHMFVLVAFQTILSSSLTAVFHASPCGRFLKIQGILRGKKLHKTNQSSNFLGSFRNRDSVKALLQFRRENQPSI